MCGLTGFLQSAHLAASAREDIVKDMAERLVHRGPDDAGAWVDEGAGIALGHRRLAILDLSESGHQPMISASGRYVIAFNGEIYNHLEIRRELDHAGAQTAWRGHSDTETLLAGFDRWGVEPVLRRAAGMFAIALWDRQERMLTLARDRVGEKPLYYGWQGGTFVFGSELKALRAHPAFRADVDRDALARYLRRGYIAAPQSIYRDIFKLQPGACLQLSARNAPGVLPTPKPYWSLREVAERGMADPYSGRDEDAIGELESLLKQAVGLQSIADVPLGAFLSGGTDSSTIVALMQAQSRWPVKTFTIGFGESRYNEAGHAKSVARHLGTDHTELYVTSRDAMSVIPKLPSLYDEPFGDSSAIPTFLVCQLARREVTVSLSGDGGDELFGGYTRYQRTDDIWSAMRRVPRFVRNALSSSIGALSGHGHASTIGWRANRLAHYLSAATAEDCYQAHIALRHDALDFVVGAGGLPQANAALMPAPPHATLYGSMMYADASTYLPDDILVKVDRAAMAVSLETRVPMLDHRVVEFAWRLPLHQKIRKREGKWLLKQVLRKYIPTSMVDRPKMGFGVPMGQWLRGPLRDWAEDLLSENRLRLDGFLNPRLAREQWLRHLGGGAVGDDSLWTVLMFQAWLRNVASSPSGGPHASERDRA